MCQDIVAIMPLDAFDISYNPTKVKTPKGFLQQINLKVKDRSISKFINESKRNCFHIEIKQMMKKIIFASIIAISCICCTAKQQTEGVKFNDREDTLFLNKEKCAIFFKLSLAEVDSIKKKYKTKEDFYITADGIAEDKYEAKTFLEENNIPVIYADTTVKVVRFKDCDINITDPSVISTIWTTAILYQKGKRYVVIQESNVDFIADYFNIHTSSKLDEKDIKYVQNPKWFGNYKYFISDTTVAPSLFIEYTLRISADSCIFSGNGQMTDFEILCSVKDETTKSLILDSVKSLSNDEPMPNTDECISPIVGLYYENGKYYLKSSFIASQNGKENTKVECEKIE